MLSAVLAASMLLLIGVILRIRLRPLRAAFVPASVAAGLVGLVVVQLATYVGPGPDFKVDGEPATGQLVINWLTVECPAVLRTWPGWLIAVVFAGLLLDRPSASLRDSLRRAGREGIVVWIIVVGQAALGLLATWLVIRPLFPELPPSFGLLIETGWAGGHGTAGAMGAVFEKIEPSWAEGRDLAMFMATVGLAWSVVSGIVYINLAVRLGWAGPGTIRPPVASVLEVRSERPAIGRAVVRREVLEPLVFQVLFLAAAFGVGLALQAAVPWVEHAIYWLVDRTRSTAGSAVNESGLQRTLLTANLPLFLFTLLGGLLVRRTMDRLKIGDLIDADSIRLLCGAAMEFLIVAAITSLKLEAVVRLAGPLAVLVVVAMAWTAFCLFGVGRWLLPSRYWFPLGLINYGMSTGTTATGFVLLRIVDQDLESGAAADYALAAPLSAPFVGGGILTLALPLMLLEISIGWVAVSLSLLVAALFGVGWYLARGERAGPGSSGSKTGDVL